MKNQFQFLWGIACAAGAGWIYSRGLDGTSQVISFAVTAACAIFCLVQAARR